MITMQATLPDLVIPNGQQYSQIFASSYIYSDAIAVGLIGSDASYPETYVIQVNRDDNATATSTDWVTLQINGTDVAPPVSGKAIVLQEICMFGAMRIKASGAVAGTRTWRASKQWAT